MLYISRWIWCLGVLAIPAAAIGQAVSVGSLPAPPNVSASRPMDVLTYVDISHPATASGQLSVAAFIWSGAPCIAAAKIKVFRQSPSGNPLLTRIGLIAERGPYDVMTATQTVALSPPIPVIQGDFIGITNLTACGTATFRSIGGIGAVTAELPGDVMGSVTFINLPEFAFVVAVELLATSGDGKAGAVNILPVAIASPGKGGAFFRTRVQLRNPQGTGRMTGHLVFHPAFAQAGAEDPSISYTLGPWEVQTIEDLLGAVGQSGIGSVDIVPVTTDLGPTVQATIYADTVGGFVEPLVRPAGVDAPQQTLIGPSDASRVRWNIGVRTLAAGATLTFVLFDANGAGSSSVTRNYPPNYFEQVPVTSHFGGATIGANASIQVRGASAIVYGVMADNLSGNATFQVATPDL